MAIKSRPLPRALGDQRLDAVWPGDSAVDIDQSDVHQWARHGGTAGLVLIPGEEPDLIVYRPLSDQGLSHVVTAMLAGSPNSYDEACRYGLVSIRGMRLRRGRPHGDIQGLEDETLAELGEIVCDLPFFEMIDEVQKSQGGAPITSEEASQDLIPTSLPKAIGALILAATFRRRRRAP